VFAFQDQRSAVEVAFTDRFGGTSTGPYAELNLSVPQGSPEGEHERFGEDAGVIEANRRLVVEALTSGPAHTGGAPQVRGVVTMRQVHGSDVVRVGPHRTDEPGTNPRAGGEPEADALVTAEPGWVLVARGADCVPVLLADAERNLVGAAHAGRRGVVAGVVPNAVAALRELGAERLVAWIGPAACGRCYEVPAALREEVAARVPETWSETSWGTPALDLVGGVRAQLRDVQVDEVVDLGECTIENADFYSHRRQSGAAGRHAGLVWVRP
jgi:YfiH family protein